MPLPPKRDPSRPLHQAVRLARIIGAIGLLFGLIVLAGALTAPAGQAGGQKVVGLVTAGIYTLFGVALIVLAAKIRRQRLWAIVVMMALAGLCLGVVSVALFETVLSVIGGNRPSGIYLVIGIELLLAAAFGKLMYDLLLSRAFVAGPRDQNVEPLPLSRRR